MCVSALWRALFTRMNEILRASGLALTVYNAELLRIDRS
jgi:hypothetical protein